MAGVAQISDFSGAKVFSCDNLPFRFELLVKGGLAYGSSAAARGR